MTPEDRARKITQDVERGPGYHGRLWDAIAAAIREAEREQMERDAELMERLGYTTTAARIRREFEKRYSVIAAQGGSDGG